MEKKTYIYPLLTHPQKHRHRVWRKNFVFQTYPQNRSAPGSKVRLVGARMWFTAMARLGGRTASGAIATVGLTSTARGGLLSPRAKSFHLHCFGTFGARLVKAAMVTRRSHKFWMIWAGYKPTLWQTNIIQGRFIPYTYIYTQTVLTCFFIQCINSHSPNPYLVLNII